ncbi:hypothetical protein, partial [Listeria monocytogenes]|uniref:hypothetical protein n=1 Tax=Listeria monocytogenes TaxID=1639 RepID=UPI003FA42D4F
HRQDVKRSKKAKPFHHKDTKMHKVKAYQNCAVWARGQSITLSPDSAEAAPLKSGCLCDLGTNLVSL